MTLSPWGGLRTMDAFERSAEDELGCLGSDSDGGGFA